MEPRFWRHNSPVKKKSSFLLVEKKTLEVTCDSFCFSQRVPDEMNAVDFQNMGKNIVKMYKYYDI